MDLHSTVGERTRLLRPNLPSTKTRHRQYFRQSLPLGPPNYVERAKAGRLETLRKCGKILTDIAESKSTDETSAGDIMPKHVTESAQYLINKLRVRGRKQAHSQAAAVGGKRAKSRNNKKIKHASR